jgi:hypothetical protein
MSDGRRKLKLDDGVWRWTVAYIRGEWWENKCQVTLWTPAGRKTRHVIELTRESPSVTPGSLREFIEKNREEL